MSRNQLLLWAFVGGFVGVGVGAFNNNIPLWAIIGIAMGLGMGYLQGKFDPETRG
jgi:hypothetical protein